MSHSVYQLHRSLLFGQFSIWNEIIFWIYVLFNVGRSNIWRCNRDSERVLSLDGWETKELLPWVTSMLVTDIGDEMCWWRFWPFKMAHFVTKIDNLFTVASVINIGASVKLHHCHQHFIKIFFRSKRQQEHSNQIHWESAITNFENYNRGFKHPVYAVP